MITKIATIIHYFEPYVPTIKQTIFASLTVIAAYGVYKLTTQYCTDPKLNPSRIEIVQNQDQPTLTSDTGKLNNEFFERLPEQLKDRIKEKIEQNQHLQLEEFKPGFQRIGTGTFKDYYYSYLNFEQDSCPDCQNQNQGDALEKVFSENGFHKKTVKAATGGHCSGISNLFGRYLLANPPSNEMTCKEIIEKFTENPDFKKYVHEYSVNQPLYYSIDPSTDARVVFFPEHAKTFLGLLFDRIPDHYYVVGSQMDDPILSIYLTLEKFQNSLVFVSFHRENEHGHLIAFYQANERLFAFDPNKGLFEFRNLETLSTMYGKILEGSSINWFASFPI